MRSESDLGPLSRRDYRRGAIMGMTMAEAFVLIAFALLLLLSVWKWRVDAEAAALAPLQDLTPAQVASVAALAAEGRLDQAIDLAQNAAPVTQAEGAWRFVPEGLADLVDRTAALPPQAQADLAALAAARAEQMVNGIDVTQTAGLADPDKLWRLIDSDELQRLMDGAVELPEDLQADLADLVAIEDPRTIAALLAAPPGDDPLRVRLDAIGGRIEAARAARAGLVAELRAVLGGTVANLGGRIDAGGAIVLPDQVLFAEGEYIIRPAMADFLRQACEPWLTVLRDSAAPVAAARIEGHASPEWNDAGPDQAFRNNLGLSQMRSQAVLNACLDAVQDPGLRDWAYGHLAAVGYSSARPVIVDGVPSPVDSRRVEFSVSFDDGLLLQEVEGAVAEGLATTPASP